MIRLSNTLKRLMKVGAILFGLAFIIAGVIGIRQDDSNQGCDSVHGTHL